MARIIVMADRIGRDTAPVLLDESVQPVHLSTGHAANQLIERLGWAISDAEEAERTHARRHSSRGQPSAAAQRARAGKRQLSAARRQLSANRRQLSTAR